MSCPQTINEVFNTERYVPFVRFCQSRGMVTMADLVRCPFEQLENEPDIGPGLAMRIKNMVVLYRRNHQEEFTPHKKNPLQDSPLAKRLEAFFRENPDRILHVAEISKAVGARRADVLPILTGASWCRSVDNTSFYFFP
ncbi:MAG: hypothetical protein PUC47_11295 [Oscillospiraceae bacterium]|nr:hypothetical protein [Oscillospiraceae bacterium]